MRAVHCSARVRCLTSQARAERPSTRSRCGSSPTSPPTTTTTASSPPCGTLVTSFSTITTTFCCTLDRVMAHVACVSCVSCRVARGAGSFQSGYGFYYDACGVNWWVASPSSSQAPNRTPFPREPMLCACACACAVCACAVCTVVSCGVPLTLRVCSRRDAILAAAQQVVVSGGHPERDLHAQGLPQRQARHAEATVPLLFLLHFFSFFFSFYSSSSDHSARLTETIPRCTRRKTFSISVVTWVR